MWYSWNAAFVSDRTKRKGWFSERTGRKTVAFVSSLLLLWVFPFMKQFPVRGIFVIYAVSLNVFANDTPDFSHLFRE